MTIMLQVRETGHISESQIEKLDDSSSLGAGGSPNGQDWRMETPHHGDGAFTRSQSGLASLTGFEPATRCLEGIIVNAS